MMLQGTDDVPLNFGFTGKGNTSMPEGLEDQILAGAIGLKVSRVIQHVWSTISCLCNFMFLSTALISSYMRIGVLIRLRLIPVCLFVMNTMCR